MDDFHQHIFEPLALKLSDEGNHALGEPFMFGNDHHLLDAAPQKFRSDLLHSIGARAPKWDDWDGFY